MAYYARHDYTGNGSLKNFSVSYPYISTTHVEVFVGGVKKTLGSDYSFSNTSTIAFVTAPGNGVAVLIKRNTPKDQRLVDYQDASVLTEDVLDLASIQMMYITQEQLDTGVEAVAIASSAETKANTAVATANSANTTANTALTNSNTAISTANSATTTANSATTTANSALSTANTASANATSAVTTANSANSTASSANTSAASAVTTANSALATANSATSTANAATTAANAATATANSAATTATNADTKATQALADSSSALAMAQSANTAAGNAQFAADAAAADADAAALSAASANASVADIRTDVDTLMGGDFSGLMQKAENLAGLADTATARVNIGLGNVDNTSDANKPVSAAVQTALNGKAATSHAHAVVDVTGLQTALDGKLSLSGGTLTGTERISGAGSNLNLSWFNDDNAVYAYQGSGRGGNFAKGLKQNSAGTNIATNAAGSVLNVGDARAAVSTFSGATVGATPTMVERLVVDEASVSTPNNLVVQSGTAERTFTLGPGNGYFFGNTGFIGIHNPVANKTWSFDLGSGNFTVPGALYAGAGNFSGLIATKVGSAAVGAGVGDTTLSIRGGPAEPAVMTFHRSGAYAMNMGLDTDNVFRLGGWSNGTNTYRWESWGNGDFKASGKYLVGTYSDTYIGPGNGDNATLTAANMRISSWYGIGLSAPGGTTSYGDGNFSHVFNTRNGNTTQRGDLVFENDAMYIKHYDTSWGSNRYIHSNNGDIGFLNSGGGWASYSTNANDWVVTGSCHAANFYLNGWGWMTDLLSGRVTKDQGHNNVGSFVFGQPGGSVTLNPGDLIAGSNLFAGSVNSGSIVNNGVALAGTWRCLGYVVASRISLFQRVS